MTLEIRAQARRAGNRVVGVAVIGGVTIAGVLLPFLGLTVSRAESGPAVLISVVVAGTLVWLSAVGLSILVGFITSKAARRAAAQLRASGDEVAIDYGRLAPENMIVALMSRPGAIGAWIDEGAGMSELGFVNQIQSVALTSQRIWGFSYYALEVTSIDASVLITLGTRWTWGAAEASRRAHRRLPALLLQ